MTGPDTREPCCQDRRQLWILEDVVTAGVYGGTIATHALDQLPPHRALLFSRLALGNGARLERGTLEDLAGAAHQAIGNADLSAPGWWSRYLNANTRAPLPQQTPRRVNAAPAAARQHQH